MRFSRSLPPKAIGVVLGLCLGCAGCTEGASEPPGASAPVSPSELELPHPDLSGIDPALRELVEQGQERVKTLLDSDEATVEELGEAFGALGQLYDSLELADAADLCYSNAKALAPEEFRWTYLLAMVHRTKSQLQEAAEGFRQALALQPESAAAAIRLGDILLELGRPQEARRYYQRVLDADPESAAALFGLGRAALALDDPAVAAKSFEAALRLQPDASAVHYPLAQAYLKVGRREEAERHLQLRGSNRVDFPDPVAQRVRDIQILTAFQVLQSFAGDVEVEPLELMRFALTHLGKVEGTADALEQVLREKEAQEEGVSPAEMARLHYVAGVLLANDELDRGAIEHFEAATGLAPDFIDAYVKLGNALARGRRFSEAVDEYTRALEIDPGNEAARLKRASARLNQGDRAGAVADLERLLADNPGHVEASIRLAQVFEAGGDPGSAAARYRSALASDLEAQERGRIHKHFGDFLVRTGRIDEAAQQYRRAVELDPTLHRARLELAAVLGHRGRYGEAAAEYARVTSERPDEEAAWLGEAAALILDQRYAEARSRLELAVARLPGSAMLKAQLARLLAAAPEPELRQGDRALELALAAYDSDSRPQYAETVAMAYAELGELDKATEWQRRAGTRDTAVRQRFRLYQEERRFRVSSPEELLIPPE